MSLKFRGVTKQFGRTRALDDVSFEVSSGEILAICGENGAGKSTLVGILAGVHPHGSYDGVVMLDGALLRLAGPGDAHRAGVALLPQELIYLPDRSVAENVLAGHLPARLGWIDRSSRDNTVRELLSEVELTIDPETAMRRLDASTRQLICIARALAFDARVLVVDEPTAALPRQAADRLHAVLRGLSDQSRTVIYISHHLSDVLGLASRVAVLRNGRLVMPPTVGPSLASLVKAIVGSRRRQPEAAAPRPSQAVGGEPRLAIRIDEAWSGGRRVIDSAAITVAAREIVGITGLVGSGAEHVLPVTVGARERSRVAVRLDGDPIGKLTPTAVRRAGIAFVPQDRRAQGLLPHASLRRNVLLGREGEASRYGVRRSGLEARLVLDALERFQVSPPEVDRGVDKLSGGNQQKVVLTRAGLGRVRALLLAEPTRGVDVGARSVIHGLIRSVANDDVAVLVSSSDLGELTTTCDRVLVMWHGSIVREIARDASGSVDETEVLEAMNGAAGTMPAPAV